MDLKSRYARAMEGLYLACIIVSGTALAVITLIIPLGVFMRYALHRPLSWPEPAAILMMVMFSFLGGAAAYRANVHIAVETLSKAVAPGVRRVLGWGTHACMAATCLFMVGYGAQLCHAVWHQSIAEFPSLSVGLTYTPIPIGGFITLLFIFERLWVGAPPASSVMYRDRAEAVE